MINDVIECTAIVFHPSIGRNFYSCIVYSYTKFVPIRHCDNRKHSQTEEQSLRIMVGRIYPSNLHLCSLYARSNCERNCVHRPIDFIITCFWVFMKFTTMFDLPGNAFAYMRWSQCIDRSNILTHPHRTNAFADFILFTVLHSKYHSL